MIKTTVLNIKNNDKLLAKVREADSSQAVPFLGVVHSDL